MDIFGGKKITVSYLVVRSDFSCVWLWQCTLDCLKKKNSLCQCCGISMSGNFCFFCQHSHCRFQREEQWRRWKLGFHSSDLSLQILCHDQNLFSFARKHSSSGLFDPRAGLLSETQQFFKTKAAVDHQINDWDHMVEEWEVLCLTERRSPV